MPTTDPTLAAFPQPLARLILRGGSGLPAAFGPLTSPDGPAAWCGDRAVHTNYLRGGACGGTIDEPDQWRLPLSHWRSRLALVAAWMLGWTDAHAALVEQFAQSVWITFWLDSEELRGRSWTTAAGVASDKALPDLPTLPTHLTHHHFAVALLCALYDVPKIRARVDQLQE